MPAGVCYSRVRYSCVTWSARAQNAQLRRVTCAQPTSPAAAACPSPASPYSRIQGCGEARRHLLLGPVAVQVHVPAALSEVVGGDDRDPAVAPHGRVASSRAALN